MLGLPPIPLTGELGIESGDVGYFTNSQLVSTPDYVNNDPSQAYAGCVTEFSCIFPSYGCRLPV
jgi:hypothetical protein